MSRTTGDIPGSFRDPSGFLFYRDGSIYRQVNNTYKDNYDHFRNSGLYQALVDAELLIPHDEANISYARSDKAYKVIKPELLPFISYPYEWCFSQLKDAALTTLKIQKTSLDFGMSLKDCSAYNIQFSKGKPILIDTLSFEKYREGEPWIAYRQFCQHFLAPLALIGYRDVRLNQLFRVYLDGAPLDLASSLLPLRTYFSFSLLSHIHLHAKSQKFFADKAVDTRGRKMARLSFLGLVESLESTIRKITWQPKDTQWGDYYDQTNYSSDAFDHKKQVAAEFLDSINPESVWDLGSNVGIFSRIASGRAIPTISLDIDPAAVEKNYLECTREGESNILPLHIDLTNPSPSIGWENQERISLFERGNPDTVIALALVHHLAISNNVPLGKLADFFNNICNSLIIEFVPKNDSQVQRLLSTREDVFPDYTQHIFEREFSKYFTIEDSVEIRDSQRTMYLMGRRKAT
ncbi:MAG: class I SAM-dependent methyltransferase [Desulfobacterales bacterium]|nr:class I SAM-dependent methyltransferase [Desulfobacterales bacterium]